MENSYNLDEDEAMGGQSDWLTNDIALDSRGEADIRDSEYLQHGASKGGFQYISGNIIFHHTGSIIDTMVLIEPALQI